MRTFWRKGIKIYYIIKRIKAKGIYDDVSKLFCYSLFGRNAKWSIFCNLFHTSYVLKQWLTIALSIFFIQQISSKFIRRTHSFEDKETNIDLVSNNSFAILYNKKIFTKSFENMRIWVLQTYFCTLCICPRLKNINLFLHIMFKNM